MDHERKTVWEKGCQHSPGNNGFQELATTPGSNLRMIWALLDVTNAFSSVPHQLLFALLERLDIPSPCRHLIVQSNMGGPLVPVGEGRPLRPTSGV